MEESYDESDEEEVKAHLKRVTQQPPLKLDASSEVHTHTDTHALSNTHTHTYTTQQPPLKPDASFDVPTHTHTHNPAAPTLSGCKIHINACI